MKTVVHAPPNEQLRIDEVYLFISVDETGEGVCAAPLLGSGSLVPLIAADQKRVDFLMPWARELAAMSGKTIKLVKFTSRSEVTIITPDGSTAQ